MDKFELLELIDRYGELKVELFYYRINADLKDLLKDKTFLQKDKELKEVYKKICDYIYN